MKVFCSVLVLFGAVVAQSLQENAAKKDFLGLCDEVKKLECNGAGLTLGESMKCHGKFEVNCKDDGAKTEMKCDGKFDGSISNGKTKITCENGKFEFEQDAKYQESTYQI